MLPSLVHAKHWQSVGYVRGGAYIKTMYLVCSHIHINSCVLGVV